MYEAAAAQRESVNQTTDERRIRDNEELSVNMRLLSRLCVNVLLVAGSWQALGQVVPVPPAWLGVWQLNPQRSTFDERAPVVPQGQTLNIEARGDTLTLIGDTLLRDGRRVPEVARVNLNGELTMGPGGVETVFRAIDKSSFDIIVSLRNPAIGEARGVNHFVFSPDGRSLVERKTQTRRVGTAVGQAAPPAEEVETVTSVLVFERQP